MESHKRVEVPRLAEVGVEFLGDMPQNESLVF